MAALATVPALLLILRLAMALMLYGFLGLAFMILWRSLRQGQIDNTPVPMPAMLVLEEEPEAEAAIGAPAGGGAPTTAGAATDTTEAQRCPLRTVTAIGRADDNTLVLQDPFASAHHALILWREERWYLEDLDSHNGTYLNGKRLTGPQPLASGDHIGIGQTILRFESHASVV
jgi:hypothetical protein